MLEPAPDPPTEPPPPALVEEVKRRRRIPAVAAAEPRGAMTPGREPEVEVEVWDWEEPLAIAEIMVEKKRVVEVGGSEK